MLETTCGHCGAPNRDDDQRCARCGRRLLIAPVAGAAVPKLMALAASEVATVPLRRPERQAPLFPAQDVSPRVVSIAASNAPPRTRTAPAARTRKDPARAAQRDFAFPVSAAPTNRTRESPLNCGAPVATTGHRLIAASFDVAMVALAFAILAAFYFFLGEGTMPDNAQALLLTLPLLAAVALLYQGMWVLGNGDSAGMRFAGLELVNFDGYRPARKERLLRMFGTWIGFAPLGLGILWSLFDEEGLTWHDMISHTIPTPAALRPPRR